MSLTDRILEIGVFVGLVFWAIASLALVVATVVFVVLALSASPIWWFSAACFGGLALFVLAFLLLSLRIVFA